jgi:hypothetical protein
MRTSTKNAAAARSKLGHHSNNHEFTRLDREIILSDIEELSKVEGWYQELGRQDDKNEDEFERVLDNRLEFI